jgi:hypothetical protein
VLEVFRHEVFGCCAVAHELKRRLAASQQLVLNRPKRRESFIASLRVIEDRIVQTGVL